MVLDEYKAWEWGPPKPLALSVSGWVSAPKLIKTVATLVE